MSFLRQVIARLEQMLDNPQADPHGKTIPLPVLARGQITSASEVDDARHA